MKCPICGGAELVKDRRDLPYTYKGQTTTIPEVAGEYCPACEEVVLDASEGERVNQAMLAFNKSVNASMVDPKFITQVRKRLKLKQREASELFGGGVNAFSRYETGKAKPAESLVVLLRLLDKRPELLKEVREIQQKWLEVDRAISSNQKDLVDFEVPLSEISALSLAFEMGWRTVSVQPSGKEDSDYASKTEIWKRLKTVPV
ncbi:type II toxin-antitoxin system MqsA family antitoxin [Parachitinimonas caeni]|uniref:type II toxin-antitoxin system MqsA family antitoxin n=1 Tax=Parachitinimonas caeni TaxID=3031301 RepID=UPI0027E4B5E2|nr:type II toxin-antitoxin system MqsA family antitoxin [Parachitinimonas caeni]